jgi:hypothetical protein
VRAATPASTVNHKVEELATVLYQPPLVYDLSESDVLLVDDHGVVFQSQCGSSSTVQPTQPTAMCTQESRNVSKGKLRVVVEEEALLEEGYKSSDDSKGAYDSDNYIIVEDIEIIERKRLAEEKDEASDEESEEEQLHYKGDTEVEGLFEMEEGVNVVAGEEPPMQQPGKKRQKLQVRRCPTTRSHSSVLEEFKPDFNPSSDEEDHGLLFDSEDDGHEAPSFILQKGKKSRAKKRKPRIWYNDKLEQPHQQLCLYMLL